MSRSVSPYADLPPNRYWKTGVSDQHPFTVQGLYTKKFEISPEARIATGGSCFAQHIGGRLRGAGYHVMDVEKPPTGLTETQAKDFGYRIYSARYGNIYLARQLLQIAREAFGEYQPAEPVWTKAGRFYDAMRPSVEPQGLDSAEEVAAHRRQHLEAVRRMFRRMDLLIFTFGLTEGWVHAESGTAYPTAPGTIAGSHDPAVFAFKNFRASEIRADFEAFRDLIKRHNADVKFLLTVSPVPLTATATDSHVLAATTYSKSVLRGVAGELAEDYDDIDYFPSYEMIASPFSRGFFYSPNLRTVEPQGVNSVMRVFFDQHPPLKTDEPVATVAEDDEDGDVRCEEALLEAFA